MFVLNSLWSLESFLPKGLFCWLSSILYITGSNLKIQITSIVHCKLTETVNTSRSPYLLHREWLCMDHTCQPPEYKNLETTPKIFKVGAIFISGPLLLDFTFFDAITYSTLPNRETGRFHEKLGDSRENRESWQVWWILLKVEKRLLDVSSRCKSYICLTLLASTAEVSTLVLLVWTAAPPSTNLRHHRDMGNQAPVGPWKITKFKFNAQKKD